MMYLHRSKQIVVSSLVSCIELTSGSNAAAVDVKSCVVPGRSETSFRKDVRQATRKSGICWLACVTFFFFAGTMSPRPAMAGELAFAMESNGDAVDPSAAVIAGKIAAAKKAGSTMRGSDLSSGSPVDRVVMVTDKSPRIFKNDEADAPVDL